MQNQSNKEIQLFNGKDLTGWDLVVNGEPFNSDENNYVQVKDGTIHMYPDVAAGEEVPFGYILSQREYSTFKLSLEYQWLDKKFAPRMDRLKDAGILVHVNGEYDVWPSSLECQIQAGDTGDVIFLNGDGSTWLQPEPDKSPEGQGKPGLLPENGGVFSYQNRRNYVGRFNEYDQLQGWNEVDVYVFGDEYAEFIVNGETVVRSSNFKDKEGRTLSAGKIGLQLEAAEIQYKNITLKELAPRFKVSKKHVSLSAVLNQDAKNQEIIVKNLTSKNQSVKFQIFGIDANSFNIEREPIAQINPGQSITIPISFKPTENKKGHRYSAGLRIGELEDGQFVALQGIGLQKFEGKNEPPLQSILYALGLAMNAGGKELHLNTTESIIGESIDVSHFEAVGNKAVKITPLARFSPVGEPPIGYITNGKKVEIGKLIDSSPNFPDAHQCLFPQFSTGVSQVEFNVNEPFSLYYTGHKQTASTDINFNEGASIKHTARIYPIQYFNSKVLENAYVVGFEEASNGDYQDALILIENVIAIQ